MQTRLRIEFRIQPYPMTPFGLPPGPKSRGILGSLPMASKDPLALFTQWARHYGDIFHYRALTRHVYFVNHPNLIQEALLTNPHGFAATIATLAATDPNPQLKCVGGEYTNTAGRAASGEQNSESSGRGRLRHAQRAHLHLR